MLHETSLLLSRITTHAAVVIGPQRDSARVRSVQLVRLHETSLLVVAVLSNGQVERQFIELAAEVDESRIGAATAVLDTQLRDASYADELVRQARDGLVVRAAGRATEPVYVGGASRIAADLEAFTAGETVGRLLEVLEHQYLVVSLVRDLIDQGVTVRIGAENQLEDLRECSIVLARFDIEGRPAGSVGVLGPTRMNYPQAMAAVAAVSRRLGEHLSPPG
jgi:heat-inducible transcriptional repressor